MTYDMSPTSRMRPIIALGALLAIGVAILAPCACGRASAQAPATNPAIVQYKGGANAGQAVVSGTSTLHDWSVTGNVIKGRVGFSGEWKAAPAATIALQSIDLAIPVDSLKSTEGSGMDDTMYDALKLKQFPTITYSLTKAILKAAPTKPGQEYQFDTTGQLTVAGHTHQVDLQLGVLPHDDGKLTITTSVALKMTDCGVTPPTAMMGMIKSGDSITVKATWELAPEAQAKKR